MNLHLPNTCKAWIFDFDGTIMDTEQALLDAYSEVHQRYRVQFDREGLAAAAGSEFNFDPWQKFAADVSRIELDRLLAVHADECYLRLPVIPGVREFISELVSEGAMLGIASNGYRAHVERHLERVGLRGAFAFLASREDVKAPKPAPDLYLRVMERFGLQAGEAIAVEDSATGILAAKRAGLRAVAVPNQTTLRQDFSKADLVLPSLANRVPSDVLKSLRRKSNLLN